MRSQYHDGGELPKAILILSIFPPYQLSPPPSCPENNYTKPLFRCPNTLLLEENFYTLPHRMAQIFPIGGIRMFLE